MNLKIYDILKYFSLPKIIVIIFFLIVFFVTRNYPITSDTHYEYAAICGFTGSLIFGFYNLFSLSEIDNNVKFCSIILLILLGLSIIQNILCAECPLEIEGIMWFIIINFPTLIICFLITETIKIFVVNRKVKFIIYFLIWSLSFLRGGYEAYYNPHIYLFAWQIGFFPGFAWDADLPITNLLFLYRFWHITSAICVYEIGVTIHKLLQVQKSILPTNLDFILLDRQSPFHKIKLKIIAISMYAACGLIIIFHRANLDLLVFKNTNNYFITTNTNLIRTSLTDCINTRFADIYIDKNKCDSLQLFKAIQITDYYILEIARYFNLDTNNLRRPQIYIYSNQEEQRKFTGAGSANFTKPWLNQVNISYTSIGSVLKHELVHILLANHGRFFGVALNQGITEGAATACENDFGERTRNEFLQNLNYIGLDTVLKQVYGFGGFANARESLCYFLSGAFTQFLIKKFGVAKFLELFHNENFELTYNSTFENLANDFKKTYSTQDTSISTLHKEIDSSEINISKYYFYGGSFFKQKCVRKIGALNTLGFNNLKKDNFSEAVSNYKTSLKFGITQNARVGLIRGLWGLNEYKTILDSAQNFSQNPNSYYMVTLLLEQADSYWNLNDTGNAIKFCDSVIGISISSNQVFRATLRRYFIRNNFSSDMIGFLTKQNNIQRKITLLNRILKKCKSKNDSLLIELLLINLMKDNEPILSSWKLDSILLKYNFNFSLQDTSKELSLYQDLNWRYLVFTLYGNMLEATLMRDYYLRKIDVVSYENLLGIINSSKDKISPKTSKYRVLRTTEFLNFANFLKNNRSILK